MSTPTQLLTLPRPVARRPRATGPRSSCAAAGSTTTRRWTQLGLEAWTRRTCGDRLWERLWGPLFDSKFDGRYDDLPATYLWSRMNRVAGTRDRKGHEVMGAIEGGYQNLVDRLADRIRARGGTVMPSTPVRFVPCANHRAIGVVLDAGFRPHDTVVIDPAPARTCRTSSPPSSSRRSGRTSSATSASSASSRACATASARTTR